MERWTKEPCLSCEVAKKQIKDVTELYEALLKCKNCVQKRDMKETKKG